MSTKGSRALQEYVDDLLLDDVLSDDSVPHRAVVEGYQRTPSQPDVVAAEPSPAHEPHFQRLATSSSQLLLSEPLELGQPRPLQHQHYYPKAQLLDRQAPTVTEELVTLEQSKREKLQALLNSEPVAAPLTATTAVEATFETTVKATVFEPIPVQLEVAAEPLPVVEVESPKQSPELASLDEGQEFAEPAVASDTALTPLLDWHPNGRPHWGQKRFDALLFNVSGLTLAVPLIALGQIQPLTEELTPIFGQADWFMGILPTANGKIRTVNTALFVMPERYDDSFVSNAKYVVSIDGLPWGLAVDSIAQPISLDPNDVKWRTERSKRPWLAGTVKSAMCALIDIPQMGKMLRDADNNKS